MSKSKKIYYSNIFYGLVSFMALTLPMIAGPIVIEDNRVMDLGTTPVLGRGYSLSTNTYQSTCLTGITLTEPSYDFTYEFQSIEKTDIESIQSKVDMKAFSGQFRNILMKAIVPSGEAQYTSEEKSYSHHILVVINLHSYYASLDESQSKMGNSAARLLVTNDIPGFFSSCGSYYVRSIGRTAKFVAVFTYQTKEENRDFSFEKELESQISGFGRDSAKDEKTANLSQSDKMRVSWQFKRTAESRKLIISVAAFGLGKNPNATLISYDIDTFKTAIKDAFISMQNPSTGKVSSIELIPWVENTDFQVLIKLDTQSIGVSEKDKGKELLLYEKKKILNMNAEFLAELERVDRSMLNLYYKAKICRQHIDENFKSESSIKTEFRSKNLLHLKGGKSYALLKLDAYLAPDKINQFLEREERFMYGGKDLFSPADWGKGAKACMRQIMQQGIFRVSYRDIPDCKVMIKNLTTVDDEVIDNYCMPMIAKED
jgi:hypothetical protein